MKFQELQAKIAGAKDAKEAKDIIADYNKTLADERKKEAEATQKESEALAGTREKLAVAIWQVLSKGQVVPELKTALANVKAKGFTYKLDTEETQYKSVELTVATVKRAGAGGTTGGGKSKDEYGVSLGEIFDKFATDEDKRKLETAASGSAQWQVKVAVKKQAIKDGLLVPAR